MARHKITIDKSKVSSNLTDFPVYVNLNDVKPNMTLAEAQSMRVYEPDGIRGDYATSVAYGAENVCTNGYAVVWHLNSVTGLVMDSTPSGNNGDYYDPDGFIAVMVYQ